MYMCKCYKYNEITKSDFKGLRICSANTWHNKNTKGFKTYKKLNLLFLGREDKSIRKSGQRHR